MTIIFKILIKKSSKIKISKQRLAEIIKEEYNAALKEDMKPPGEGEADRQFYASRAANKPRHASSEEVEAIADLMANDPEFQMFQPFVDKFKRYSKSGGAAASSLEAALPEYISGSNITKLINKAQASLTGDETPIPQPDSPGASPEEMAGYESDYRDP